MVNVILTAGSASRMGDAAPYSCKALVEFRGKPMIEHQLERLGPSTIVCQTQHAPLLEGYGYVVTDDSLEGPAHVLYRGLHMVEGLVTVAYADTFWDEPLPEGDAWCGSGQPSAQKPRVWDHIIRGVVKPARMARIAVPTSVCIGLYRFPDAQELRREILLRAQSGIGLALLVNRLQLPFVEMTSWIDVGSKEALVAAE